MESLSGQYQRFGRFAMMLKNGGRRTGDGREQDVVDRVWWEWLQMPALPGRRGPPLGCRCAPVGWFSVHGFTTELGSDGELPLG